MKKILLIAGAVGLIAAAGALPLFLVKRSSPQADLRRRFDTLLEGVENGAPPAIQSAAKSLAAQKDLLQQPLLLERLAKAFADRRLPSSEDALQAGLTFWKILLDSDIPALRKPAAASIARLRHIGLLTSQSSKLAAAEAPNTCSPEQQNFLSEKLLKDHFTSAARNKTQPNLLLWDKAQMEEMAGKASEAAETIGQIRYSKVREHWELAPERDRYVLLRTDLISRVARRLELQNDAAQSTDLLDIAADDEVRQFLKTEPERKGRLLDGLVALNLGEADKAIEEIDLFLSLSGVNDSMLEFQAPAGYVTQFGLYLRAAAHHLAAQQAYRQLRPGYIFKKPPEQARLRLKFKLIETYFEIGFLEEFDDVLQNYFDEASREKPLLAAVRGLLADRQGDRDQPAPAASEAGDPGESSGGGSGAAARDRRAIAKFLKENSQDLHEDDRRWLENLAAGRKVAAQPVVPALFGIGRIYDELGDLPRLEKTVQKMEYFVEGEEDQFCINLTRAILLSGKGLILDAWQTLQKLLNQKTLPRGVDRGFLNALVQDLDRMTQGQTRVRRHIRSAEDAFRKLYFQKKDIHPEIALAAGAGFYSVKASLQLMDPDPDPAVNQNPEKLFIEVAKKFDAQERLSYFLERAWLGMRNQLVHNFQDNLQRGNFQQALESLDGIGRLNQSPRSAQILRQKALVHKERARQTQEVAGRDPARADWQEAARLFGEGYRKSPQDFLLLKEAIAAFEEYGDSLGILKTARLNVEKIPASEKSLLLAVGKALIRVGDYQKGIQVLNRLIQIYWGVDVITEELDRTLALGALFPVLLPDDLTEWLELDPIVEPANHIGVGQIFFDAQKQSLRWQSPGDRQPGPEVAAPEGARLRLQSSGDPRKTLLVQVRKLSDGVHLPRENKSWEIRIAQRDFPEESADAYLWRSLAQIQQAQSALPSTQEEALRWVEEHLHPDGDPLIQAGIEKILEKILDERYQVPESRQKTLADFRREISAWETSEAEAQTADGPGSEAVLLKQALLKELKGQIATPRGAAALFRQQNAGLQKRLGAIYLDLVQGWLVKNGEPARRELQDLENERKGSEARKNLVFLCEYFGNRHPVWQAAMFLRGFQLYRRAASLGGGASPAAPQGAPIQETAAKLRREARDVLSRFVLATEHSPPAEWYPMALYLLGNLEVEEKQLDAAHARFEHLAQFENSPLLRRLSSEDLRSVQELIQDALLRKADLSFQLQRLPRALQEYQQASLALAGSPLLLWCRYQMGNCHQGLGRNPEALKEFHQGKSLLNKEFQSPQRKAGWLTGDRRQAIARHLSLLSEADAQAIRQSFEQKSAVPEPAAADLANAGEQKDFWSRLFDIKIKLLSGSALADGN